MEQKSSSWWTQEGEELGQCVWNTGIALETEQAGRKHLSNLLIKIYENDEDDAFSTLRDAGEAGEMGLAIATLDDLPLNYNLTRAACDTVHAEIAGRQKPVPKFQTSGADWKTKRQAKRLEKMMRSVLARRQGAYLNAWELMQESFHDASLLSVGVVKAVPEVIDEENKVATVSYERHFHWELFVDPVEARYGKPKSLFHVYLMDRESALWQFADDPELDLSDEEREANREAIGSAENWDRPGTDDFQISDAARTSDQVKVVEAWRLPTKSEEGMHAYALNGQLMHSEEWERENFPFVFMRWSRRKKGFWATSLAEHGLSIHKEVNSNARKLQERFELCGNKRTWVPRSANINIEQMQTNEAENIIEFDGNSPPIEAPPKPIADAEKMWLDSCFDRYFEVTGVSQMRASARKEPGVTAGVAIRTLNDMQSARFSIPSRMYENAYVDLSNITIEICKELDDAGYTILTSAGDEVEWSEVELPENSYDIAIAPTSSLPNDPAGRMQMTQELYSAGIIGQETYKHLLGWPDLEREMNHQTAQTNWLEQTIDEMLDDKGFYEPPDDKILDKGLALIQVGQAYFEALYDKAPDWALSKLRQYIDALTVMVEQAKQAEMLAQQQMMAPQMGAQPGGMAPPPGMGNRPGVAG